MSYQKLNLLHVIGNSISKCNKICPLAKQTRLPFSTSIKTTKPFELVYLDVWGMFHTPTHNGQNYFLTIVDDYSRATWLFLMNDKTEVYPRFKQ